MSRADASDEDLLRAWRRGDRDAGGRLLAHSARSLSALARAICGDASLAEEATQEAYLRIVRGLGRFRDGARFRPWAYAIARNAAWDQVRRRRPEPELEAERDVAPPTRLAAWSHVPAWPPERLRAWLTGDE